MLSPSPAGPVKIDAYIIFIYFNIDIEDDILSKIVQSGEPELLSEIPSTAETDVIRYYSTAQSIRSFVGVPLFYDKTLIAIIAVDSKDEDAFGIETIYALGRFVRVIT